MNFPKPILANTAVTRSNTCFIMRGQLYGSRQQREIPRLRKRLLARSLRAFRSSGPGMRRGEMREWPHAVRSSQRLLNQKAFGVRNDNGKPLASGKRELRACPFRSRNGSIAPVHCAIRRRGVVHRTHRRPGAICQRSSGEIMSRF